MPSTYYDVCPRYSGGSPALVDQATARHVARSEIACFVRATTWGRGFVPADTAKADTLGLAGIVYMYSEGRTSWSVVDLITGWVGTIPFKPLPRTRAPRDILRLADHERSKRLCDRVYEAQGYVGLQGVSEQWASLVTREQEVHNG